MDFDNTQDANHTEPPQSTPPQQPHTPPAYNIPDFSSAVYDPFPKKKKGSGWKVFWGIVLVLSILANGFMLLAMIGMGAVLAGGSGAADNGLVEKVLIDGHRANKIAVINIQGVIDGEMSEWVQKQVQTAEDDDAVKALIVRIDSPGGGVSSSDQIHYYINRFKEHTGKPVLAFMQSIAASGGYYSAVACDAIMAEPTVITGSIGVIMNHLVIKDLLEEKLGINPVTLKSGERKDWPSMFNETTDEEKQYLMDQVITPAYDRFVDLVAEGRKNVLAEEQIRELADGSIYTAQQAVENKLIDSVGYFDHAVSKAEQMANISDARVVTYEELFSFWSLMGAQSKAKINLEAEILEKLAAPRILYLWDGKR
ncbi:MAG: signal peptide peptidase SppA [Planctomycetota bacterium]|jgi:protease-4